MHGPFHRVTQQVRRTYRPAGKDIYVHDWSLIDRMSIARISTSAHVHPRARPPELGTREAHETSVCIYMSIYIYICQAL